MELQQKRRKVPARVPVAIATGGDVVKLEPERKLLTNLVKMVAYQAESDLFHLASPYYKRATDEGRTLIQSALAAPADITLLIIPPKLKATKGAVFVVPYTQNAVAVE
jgi:D-aminopeptidase